MDRRTFLRAAGAGSSVALSAVVLGACGAPRRVARRRPVHRGPTTVDGLPVADWLIAENRRPGTIAWVFDPSAHARRAPIEGYADRTSVTHGDELAIYVNTQAATWRAEVFRMGYYQGLGGRRILRTHDIGGRVQPAATFVPDVNMVRCDWVVSHRFAITDAFPPGNYLVRLEASTGRKRYIPFTVRDDSSRAAVLMQNSVTTWQAYNRWGGYSLYGGVPIGGASDYESRSRIVSFDRPYGSNLDAGGSGDWLGNEFPFLYLAERHGLDLAYATNVDVDADPARLTRHRVLVSLGHDEYWSHAMRYGVQDALHGGLNVAFLGANACYRQIRFASSPLGPRREVICYKDYLADPIHKAKPWLATGVSWASTPDQTPESTFIGAMYQGFGASGDLVVTDPGAFVFAGTGLRRNDRVPRIIGSEYDAFEPQICPTNVEILAHSPTTGAPGYSDMTYYTTPSGGGVLDTGTADFVTSLWDGTPRLARRLAFAVPEASAVTGEMALNLLRLFCRGPASRLRPSVPNWKAFYSPSAPVHLGHDTT